GQQVALRLTIPGYSVPIVIKAEVRWVRALSAAEGALPAGAGVRFISPSIVASASIAALLQAQGRPQAGRPRLGLHERTAGRTEARGAGRAAAVRCPAVAAAAHRTVPPRRTEAPPGWRRDRRCRRDPQQGASRRPATVPIQSRVAPAIPRRTRRCLPR